MLGAIAGDIIGSVHEHIGTKSEAFELFVDDSRFTDDTVLSVAVADALLGDRDYARAIRAWGQRYPRAGYGGRFRKWLADDQAGPYNSFGNGSAMRVSPVAWLLDDLEEVLREAEATAVVTHSHPEGVKGAQAAAGAVFLARKGATKMEIRELAEGRFGYDCSESYADLHAHYSFDVTCQGTMPAAFIALFEADDFEDAIRKSIALGGDADTLAAIVGSIAEALWGGVPEAIWTACEARLSTPVLAVVQRFRAALAG